MPLIRVRDVDLFYELNGPAGAPVVAFSNSIGATMEMWDGQVSALKDRYRCLRYDTRGHGRSPVIDRPVSMEELADDLVGLIDALAIPKAHVVGLSLGGMTAQAFALRHANRLISLVLMATSAFLPPPNAWLERAATVRSSGMIAIVDTVIRRWFTPDFVELSPDRVASVRERFLAIDPRGYAWCCEAIAAMDLRLAVAAISARTLILAGGEDPATPVSMMEDLRSRIAGSAFEVVSPAAHFLNIEQAGRANHLLARFLDSERRRPDGIGG